MILPWWGLTISPRRRWSSLRLTTVSVAAKEIGRKAGELLYSRIQGNNEPPKRIILPAALVIRESCGFS
ncbi:LacI family transcriptional regulator [Enterobacter cancerogenus]|uniref:LacI family transcriptional regulator n=1 Tax=Enterobacter cancerogenus TaxID=69218 RepID=A0A484VWJ6_9ENTR|nr:LacI family transcriptional regulator [Enterobacter cancerogenus]